MALCCLLAFSTGGDAQRVDRLFRGSGIMREKWDAVYYADGATYGEVTIERACRVTSERYDPECADEADHGQHHVTTESGEAGGARADDSTVCDGTGTASDPPADASAAHLREANAVLRERIREQQARIETLEAQLADGSTAAEGTTHDGAADAQSPSVVQRLRGVFARRGAGSTDEP
jgi:primase-polymerase (primpol)-like protein